MKRKKEENEFEYKKIIPVAKISKSYLSTTIRFHCKNNKKCVYLTNLEKNG